MIPELSALIILIAGILLGVYLGHLARQYRLHRTAKKIEASEQARLARSAEIQHKALANGKEFGLYGKYIPDGSRTALEEAREEADNLRAVLK